MGLCVRAVCQGSIKKMCMEHSLNKQLEWIFIANEAQMQHRVNGPTLV